MIKITQEGSKVILKVDIYPIGYVFNFSNDCGTEWAAKAIYKILNEAFIERVQSIRRDEYQQGLKDAKKKKDEHKTWFRPWLDK